MASVTAVKASFGHSNLGTFHAEKFSMFEADDLARYSDLRNRANDASNGIKIEMMREYSRKVTTHDGSGEDQTTTISEEIVLVVQYWEKKPKREHGDSDDEIKDAKKDWSRERDAK